MRRVHPILQVVAALLTLSAALLMLPRHASALQNDREDLIKSGMVRHFLDYTEWPAESFASERSALVITVLGGCLDSEIEQTLRVKHASGRDIAVRRMQYPAPPPGQRRPTVEQVHAFYDELRKTHALFICGSEAQHLGEILSAVRRLDILTISDLPEFAESGGMLGLVRREGKVAFDANVDAIRETDLKVSSKLLRMARIVTSRERR